jgi:hypothetical protein
MKALNLETIIKELLDGWAKIGEQLNHHKII